MKSAKKIAQVDFRRDMDLFYDIKGTVSHDSSLYLHICKIKLDPGDKLTKKFYLLYESASSTVYKERISAGYEARIPSVLSTDIFMTPLCPCPSFGVRYGIQPT